VSAFTAAPSSQHPQASAPILGLQIRCPCTPCGQPASVEAAVIDSFQPLFIIHFCLALRVPRVGPVSISSRGGLLGILITSYYRIQTPRNLRAWIVCRSTLFVCSADWICVGLICTSHSCNSNVSFGVPVNLVFLDHREVQIPVPHFHRRQSDIDCDQRLS